MNSPQSEQRSIRFRILRVPLINWLIYILMIIVLVITSGCIKMNLHITLNKDGSSEIEVLLLKSSTIDFLTGEDDPFNNFEENLMEQGFDIIPHHEEDMSGIKAFKSMTPEELMEVSVWDIAGIDPPEQAKDEDLFTVEEGFLLDRYHLKTTISLEGVLMGEDDDNNSSALLKLIRPDTKFILTMPIRPERHNANRVSEDGKTMEWDLSLSEDTQIELTAGVPNFSRIAFVVVVIGALLILIILVFIYMKHRPLKSKGSSKIKPKIGH